MLTIYRARWSFPDQTLPLLDTGRLMARWAETVAGLLLPEHDWVSTVQEHADFDLAERWEASHVVHLRCGELGEGVSRLTAGGRKSAIGATAGVSLWVASPVRFLDMVGNGDVKHWDVVVGGMTRGVVDAMRAGLEAEMGTFAVVSGERELRFEPGPRCVVTTDDEADALLWVDDLTAAGMQAERRHEGRWEVHVLGTAFAGLEALESARVTLGEVLAEGGVEEWERMTNELLVQLPVLGGAA